MPEYVEYPSDLNALEPSAQMPECPKCTSTQVTECPINSRVPDYLKCPSVWVTLEYPSSTQVLKCPLSVQVSECSPRALLVLKKTLG